MSRADTRREAIAGVTTFFTMATIVVVNPAFLTVVLIPLTFSITQGLLLERGA